MAIAAKNASGPVLLDDDKPKSKNPPTKNQPTKTLPHDRVPVARQLEIIRGYAAASAQGSKAVRNIDVASTIGMAQETISSCNAFLSSIGLIQKGEGGWIVSPDVQAFYRAYDWNKDTASYKLGPLVQQAWFSQFLLPKLGFRPMDEEEAVSQLGELSAAGPDFRRALRMLIDYMEAAGLIQRDGGLLKPRNPQVSSASSEPIPEPQKQNEPATDTAPRPGPRVTTGFSQMAQGAMRFNVSFDVDMSEMANWRADRIAAFFNGLAQVLAAKAEVEKTAHRE